MPFSFFPGGLILALAVLGGAFVLFALALRLMDRAAASVRFSVASGLVAGMRQWAPAHELSPSAPPAAEPPAAAAPHPADSWSETPAPVIEDLATSAIRELERVQRR